MRPKLPLPLAEEWTDVDSYVESLLNFTTECDFFNRTCGGVHILDFLTREPDIYTTHLPADWREFFTHHSMADILDFFIREDIYALKAQSDSVPDPASNLKWRDDAFPPSSLVDYIYQIRRLTLRREFAPPPGFQRGSIPRRLAVGMRPKKYHEVENFANYVDCLCEEVQETRGEGISHIVDFGSGQNYLGRTLASDPYDRHIIAIERKHQYISGAKGMDVQANIEKKKEVVPVGGESRGAMRAKKRSRERAERRKRLLEERVAEGLLSPSVLGESPSGPSTRREEQQNVENGSGDTNTPSEPINGDDSNSVLDVFGEIDIGPEDLGSHIPYDKHPPKPPVVKLKGGMNYIEHDIQDGYLEPIIKDVVQFPGKSAGEGQNAPTTNGEKPDPRVMVISLHSCGNLLHHGVRSLVLNPSVVAIAMIGCCYNLMTQRLGPATYKLPELKSYNPCEEKEATGYDPHGFPMSKLFETYPLSNGTGVKASITARSMALQAPSNWSREESENYFTRHFYRALLQRILIDRGVVDRPTARDDPDYQRTPLIVGSLRKTAFESFSAYVHAAIAKFCNDPLYGEKIKETMGNISEDEIEQYVKEYWPARKNLAVLWSLMAFSASVIEALIVVDRWQFLREHDSVKDCWVEPVFEFEQSPRNLAVVGIKK